MSIRTQTCTKERTYEDTRSKRPSTNQVERCQRKPTLPILWNSILQNCEKISFYCLSLPACVTLLWQLQQTKTSLHTCYHFSHLRQPDPFLIPHASSAVSSFLYSFTEKTLSFLYWLSTPLFSFSVPRLFLISKH